MTSARAKLSSKNKNTSTMPYRSLFVIVVEGETEEEYFKQRWFRATNVTIKLEVGKHSNPQSLINSAETLITKLKEKSNLRSGDQAWIVLDKDNNEMTDLEELISWKEDRKDRYIGFSDPQFEYWILLHYDLCNGIRSQDECIQKLKHFNPNYKKNKPFSFTKGEILEAIKNGKQKYNGMQNDFSLHKRMINSNVAFTNLHILTENLLNATRHIKN